MHHLGLALLLAVLPVAGPTAPEGVVIERVVAVIRNPAGAAPSPLTLTRLDEEARVALVGQGAVSAALAPLDAVARRAALRWLVDQRLVSDEARRLKVEEASAGEVDEAQQAFRRRFPDLAGYRRFLAFTEISEEELRSILARGVRVQRLLGGRTGRGARVSEEEVTRWLAGQGVMVATSVERESARARMVSDRTQGQVRQLLSDLRARADVRVLVPELREEREP